MAIQVPSEQSVEPTALRLPGAPQLGDHGLSATARGAGVAADQLRAIEIERQKKRNATMVFQAEQALADSERDMRASHEARRGAEAYNVTNSVSAWWESEPAKVEGTLENETQRELFRNSAARRREVSLNGFSQFEARETTAAAVNASQARQANAIDTAASNFSNPQARALARQEIVDAVGVQSAFQGLAPDDRAAVLKDSLTKMHQQVIENMMSVDPNAADEYFVANKDEIAGSMWDTLRTKLDSSKDIAVAQTHADDIWSRGLSNADALKAAREETKGAVREQTLALLRTQYNEREQQINDYNRNQIEASRSRFEQGGYSALTPNDIATLGRIAPGELRAMRETRPQDQIPSNWDVYDGMVELWRNERSLFADVDLQMHRADLNSRELQVLQKMQDDVKSDRTSPTGTLTQLLGEVAWDSKDREEKGAFERSVREVVAREQFANNDKLTEDQTRQIIDRQLMEVTIPRNFWFDSSARLFETTPEQRANLNIEIGAIPAADRAQVAAALEERGLAVNDENIVRLFRAVNGIQ